MESWTKSQHIKLTETALCGLTRAWGVQWQNSLGRLWPLIGLRLSAEPPREWPPATA